LSSCASLISLKSLTITYILAGCRGALASPGRKRPRRRGAAARGGPVGGGAAGAYPCWCGPCPKGG
ncbi:hypothetical protein SK128_008109, partial [Halocaridina rubra]